MNTVRNILCIKVVVIILLHTLITHSHHGEMTYEEHKIAHENADDFIDYLGLAFHKDLIGDIENYKLTEQSSKDESNFNGINFLTSIHFTEDESIFAGVSLYSRTQSQKLFNVIILLNGLRAPPSNNYYS